jgi:serine/threonine protein kinase
MADDSHNTLRSTTRTTAAPLSNALAGTSYRVVGWLGEGGAATVYEAEHIALGKRVAVKLIKRGFGGDPSWFERTRIEAQALAKLRSPFIVDVSDFGHTTDGRPFFVMELLRGCSLHDELRRRVFLPPAEAIAIVQQLLRGLSTAHEAGIIHRDIKLENLFLCEAADGRRTLKILDFGIAKIVPGTRLPEPPALTTEQGIVLGTPRFLSPEQAMGRAVDARTDVYGAAVVLYGLLSSRDPFHHVEGYGQLLEAHVSEAPRPPSELAPQPIEPAIDDVVLRALSKRPSDRYASAADFSAALAHALELSASIEASTTSPAALSVEPGLAPSPTVTPRERTPSLRAAVLIVFASAVLSAVLAVLLSRAW